MKSMFRIIFCLFFTLSLWFCNFFPATAAAEPGNLYIPPQGVYFLLRNYESARRPYLLENNGAGAVAKDDPENTSQYWQLIPGIGNHKGFYGLKVYTGNHLRSYGDTGVSGSFGTALHLANQHWDIVPGKGRYAGYFKLRNTVFNEDYKGNRFLYAGKNFQQPGDSFGISQFDSPDQYWTFIFRDVEVVDVSYDFNKAIVLEKPPNLIANQVLFNQTPIKQTQEFGIDEEVSDTSFFERSDGLTIEVGAQLSLGIPIFSVSGSLTKSETKTITYGKEQTFKKVYKSVFPVDVPPCAVVTASATVNNADLAVPYTIKLLSPSTGVEVNTYGTWLGVSSWNLTSKFNQTKTFPIIQDENGRDKCDVPEDVRRAIIELQKYTAN